MKAEPSLSGKRIQNAVNKKLEGYKNLTFLEQYAMFMGKAQILKFGLKSLLARKYKVPFESMEKWTLGRVKKRIKPKRVATRLHCVSK